jgi:hypothetical protein
MQAGVTGINALRVYNVVKQGKDHDPEGIFIRRYIPELRDVPLRYLHEPSKMTAAQQATAGVCIAATRPADDGGGTAKWYPSPVVDTAASARLAKQRVSAVSRLPETKAEARQVFLKHGSRRGGGASEETAPQIRRRRGANRACSCGHVEFIVHGCTCGAGGRGRGRGRGRGGGRGRGVGTATAQAPNSRPARNQATLAETWAGTRKRQLAPSAAAEPKGLDAHGAGSATAGAASCRVTNAKRMRTTAGSVASGLRHPRPKGAAAADKVDWGFLFSINSASSAAQCPTQCPTQESVAESASSWACTRCTFLNHAALSSCEMCETTRSAS